MSEPIPEAIPTSQDPRNKRPTKRRALSPTSAQATALTNLFSKPDREIHMPTNPKTKVLPPPPEIVTNVQGSSAGAGSGEFHVYKAARRREYERIRLMEEEVEREKAEREFLEKTEGMKRRDEEKTEKNRRKRRKKGGKGDGKKGGGGGAAGIKTVNGEAASKGGTEEGKRVEDGGADGADGEAMAPGAGGGGLIIHDDDD
ncbi:hypothetical protein HOY82DRAFT_561728 [Tuber indicum]|nr:hypothetical protein HOY82DRAFT_561728 [Tuber indicum]